MAHILSFSYDPILLMTRELLLQQLGHTVTSVRGFARALAACESGKGIDLLILDHSIPHEDKAAIMAKVKDTCNCPVLALLLPNESQLPGAERSIDSFEPKLFMEAVREMVDLHIVRRKIV
jgi:CheY-like chemotaxis protein